MNTNPRGFTILEILVASSVLVILLIPVLMVSQRGTQDAGSTREDLLARKLVIDMCERFKRAKPDELKRLAADPAALEQDAQLASTDSTLAEPGGLRLKRQLEFSENFDGIPGVHRLRFEVSWAPRSGRSRSISLSRLIHAH